MNLLLPYSRRRPRPPLLLATDASDNDNAPKTMITSCGHPQNLVATATILTYCLKQREKPPRNQRHSSTLDKGMVLLYVIAAISLTKSMHSVPFAVGFGFAPVPKQHNIVIQRVEIRNTFISPLKSISTISSKKSRLWLEANSANDDNKNNSNSNSNSNSNKGGGDDPSKPRKGRRTSGRPTRHFLRSQRKFEKEKNDYFDNDKQDSGRSSSRNFTSSSPASSIPTTSSSRSTKKPPTPSIRDQMSSPNHPRAKMKKLSSSSFSTLLPPPSILSRLSSTGSSSGRRWENTYGSQRSGSRGSASRSFQGNDDGGGTNGDGIRGGDQSRKWAVSASQLPSKKQKQPVRTFKASSKGESRREQQRGELSAKPKSGSSKERSSFTGGGSSWDSVFDYLPPPSSKSSGKEKNTDLPQWGSLFENQPGAPYPSSSESPLFSPTAFPSPAIDGVLPVSELFYRSTQSISSSMGDNEEEDNEEYGDNSNSKSSTSKASAKQHKKKKAMDSQDLDADELGDDEELPFSAEQSDRLSIPGNKIQIRRNKAAMSGGNDTSFFLDDIATGMGMSMGGSTFPSEAVQRELTTMAEQEQEEQRRLELRTRQQQQQQQQQQQSSSRAVNVDDNNEEEENDSTCEEDTVTKRKNDSRKGTKSRNRKTKSGQKGDRAPARKMVRRGMEMLVGGEPINADPPQRSIELNYYRKHPKLWARSITTNSPDFGPLLHMHSAGKVGEKSLGLYCENFVSVMQKWNICPDDLKFVVSEHEVRRRNLEAAAEHAAAVDAKEQRVAPSVSAEDMEALIQSLSTESDGDDESSAEDGTTNNSDGSPPALEVDIDEGIISDGSGRTIMFNPRELNAPKGFGAQKQMKKKSRDSRGGGSGMESEKSLVPVHTLNDGDSSQGGPLRREEVESEGKLMFTLGGELKFSLGVTRAELESGHGGAFRRVLKEGIGSSINSEEMGFDVHIAKLLIVDVEGGSTDVVVQFQLDPREAMDIGEAERAAKEVNGALASAMDDGKMALALAHVAREEKGWSAKIRNRIVEEFLFETEDDDEDKEFHSNENDADEDEDIEDFSEDDDDKASSSYERESDEDDDYDGPFGMEGEYAKDDIFLGGGNGGVFFDYSESNYLNSPYKGELGPYLVDAATERARQNHPRVIAIGDVHGCIDELQALLKKCDYHPGDTVVFLGDLVCKGPDSLSVVQMAREIGAIGVRGNHDFEVVRWHQAIKSGADPPVIGSEHYYVASALSTADLKWMYSLPWFISSSHLNALFVHAGFVSGIRLAKQNPRLMMNMRSILPDGTVTSKFFNNWPWARLWDGPQTVMFGHDADRGLQKYDHAIGLDTGCVYGGKLTACILPERRLVSVNAKREYFQYRRKHFD